MNTKFPFLKTILFIFVVSFSLQMTAQQGLMDKFTPEEVSEKQTALISEKLDLSAQEVEQLKVINLKYANELKALHEKGKSPEMRKKIAVLNHSQNEEVQEILKQEDFEAYLVLKKEMHQRHKMRMKRDAKSKMRENIKKNKTVWQQMGLTDNQKEQLKEIRLKYKSERDELKSQGRSKENFEKLKSLRAAQNDEVKEVLNEEQFDMYMQMQNERKEMFKNKRAKRNR